MPLSLYQRKPRTMTTNEAIITYWLAAQSNFIRKVLKLWDVRISYSISTQSIVLKCDRHRRAIALAEDKHHFATNIDLQIECGRLYRLCQID